MEQCSEKNTKGNLHERKLKCVDGQNPILDRILKGETVIDGTLNTFISQWVSSANACQIQNLAGRKGYICLPMRVKDETVGLILAGWNDDGKDLERMRNALDRVASLAALAIKGAWLFENTSNQRKKLRALSAKMLELQEAERKRIAQELHDRVGQNLTGISINLGIIRSFLPPEEIKKVQSRLVDCVELVGNTMSCIRDVMAELDPPGLSDYGLEIAIKCYCDQFSKRTGLKVSVVNTGGMEDAFLLAREGEIALFRIAQEALTNAAKHSKATEVIVSLNVTAEELVLSIADNGVGFDVDDQPFWVDGGRFGIGYMRERAEAIGGEFRMESTPGKGTRIIVRLIKVKP
jgi:signal transduction histidine kinase